MTKKVLILASPLVLALASAGCDQPVVKCQTARGEFAVKFNYVAGSAKCTDATKLPTVEGLKGDRFSLQTYNYLADSQDRPDYARSSMALQSDTIGQLVDRALSQDVQDANATHKPFATGDFDTPEPVASGDEDFCTVSTLSVAEQDLPTVPAVPPDPKDPEDKGLPEQPATKIKYEWGWLALPVSPAHMGTWFTGPLTYGRDDCSAKYTAIGLYPAVGCEGMDKDGNPTGKPDDRLCSAEPIAEAGMVTGSGINPDYKVKCDSDILLCVIDISGIKLPK